VALTNHRLRLLSDPGENRKQDGHEQRDDGDHHEQLDQCEAPGINDT
jgi:hypothetical protein